VPAHELVTDRVVAEADLVRDVDLFDAPLVAAHLSAEEICALRSEPDVARVEVDEGFRIQVDGSLPARIAQLPRHETVPPGVSAVGAPEVWSRTTGRGVRAAVLDTGIDRFHPNIAPNFGGGVSFVPGEPSSDDLNGHGTHCAGILAGARCGRGIVGVAPDTTIYAVKVSDHSGVGGWRHLIAGLSWCLYHNIQVVNLSIGDARAPAAVRSMCATAARRGLFLVAGAGDDGPKPNSVNYPAAYPSVLAVAAIDSKRHVAAFSSRGPRIAIAAPGVAISSCLPDHSAGLLSGTSMAAPHVSGVASLVVAAFPSTKVLALADALRQTARPLGRRPNTATGWGLASASAAIDFLERAVAGTSPGRQRKQPHRRDVCLR